MDNRSRPDPALLRLCGLSGQISDSQWQEHVDSGEVDGSRARISAQAVLIAALAQTMKDGVLASDFPSRLHRIETATSEIWKEIRKAGLDIP